MGCTRDLEQTEVRPSVFRPLLCQRCRTQDQIAIAQMRRRPASAPLLPAWRPPLDAVRCPECQRSADAGVVFELKPGSRYELVEKSQLREGDDVLACVKCPRPDCPRVWCLRLRVLA